jgi:(1->4)-alpha-D-glucan 1-alpha-D-glucosylmutase
MKLTAPGVPDTYQGSELWDLHLVDPDNRGAVDYEVRQSLLAELVAGMPIEEIVKRSDSGLPKLWVIYKALHLRRTNPQWFGTDAAYTPLAVEGAKSEHVIAYLRGDHVVTLAKRLNVKLGGSWAGASVELPQNRFRNMLTGEVVNGGRQRIQTLLNKFPVALLVTEAE